MACQGFLVREACVSVLLGGAGFFLSGVQTCALPILFILLCLGWPFHILAVCGVLFIMEFPCCGWVGRVACQGFLVREACVGVLVGGAGFLFSGVQSSVQ